MNNLIDGLSIIIGSCILMGIIGKVAPKVRCDVVTGDEVISHPFGIKHYFALVMVVIIGFSAMRVSQFTAPRANNVVTKTPVILPVGDPVKMEQEATPEAKEDKAVEDNAKSNEEAKKRFLEL